MTYIIYIYFKNEYWIVYLLVPQFFKLLIYPCECIYGICIKCCVAPFFEAGSYVFEFFDDPTNDADEQFRARMYIRWLLFLMWCVDHYWSRLVNCFDAFCTSSGDNISVDVMLCYVMLLFNKHGYYAKKNVSGFRIMLNITNAHWDTVKYCKLMVNHTVSAHIETNKLRHLYITSIFSYRCIIFGSKINGFRKRKRKKTLSLVADSSIAEVEALELKLGQNLSIRDHSVRSKVRQFF